MNNENLRTKEDKVEVAVHSHPENIKDVSIAKSIESQDFSQPLTIIPIKKNVNENSGTKEDKVAENYIMVAVENIHPHPQNPRKNIGDISELAKSIKIQGLLQPLTIIPIEDKPGEYYSLIGNRRHAAAKLAGLKEVPCDIRHGLTIEEQNTIMLAENIIREDLTVLEEAQGFQMMLDLGETRDTLADKTGFSKSTIEHRLNIAKLKPELVKKKEADKTFQLNMTDLYALEGIPSIAARNKILKEAKNSADLLCKIEAYKREEKHKKASKQIVTMLKQLGMEQAPDGIQNEIYSSKWEIVKRIDLDKEIPKKEELKLELIEPIFYTEYYRQIFLLKKARKREKTLTAYEIQQKHITINKRQIKAIAKNMAAARKSFIQNIISGKIKAPKDAAKADMLIWQVLVQCGTNLSVPNQKSFFLSKPYYEAAEKEIKDAEKKVEKLKLSHHMLIATQQPTASLDLVSYDGTCNISSLSILNTLYTALEIYGFTFSSEEEKELLDGTHKLYVKKEKKTA